MTDDYRKGIDDALGVAAAYALEVNGGEALYAARQIAARIKALKERK